MTKQRLRSGGLSARLRDGKFESKVQELVEGKITFERFLRDTVSVWQSMARALHRRWCMPPAVTEEDIFQELRYRAWEFWPQWDASRGPAARAILHRSYSRTLSFIHAQRGAGLHGRPNERASRFPISESFFSSEDDDGAAFLDRQADGEDSAEAVLAVTGSMREQLSCLDDRDLRIAQEVVLGGEVPKEEAERVMRSLEAELEWRRIQRDFEAA